MRVQDPRRPFVDERRGQQAHEPAQHDEIGLPHRELRSQLSAPLLAAVELHPRHHERRDAVILGMREPVGLAVGADDDHSRRVVRIGGRIQECPKIRPGARDEDRDR